MDRGIPYENFLYEHVGSKIDEAEKGGNGLSKDEKLALVIKFIKLFENEAAIAYGRPIGSESHTRITKEFWIYFRGHAEPSDFSFDMMDSHWRVLGPRFGRHFMDVVVEVNTEPQILPRKGRMPKSGWKIASALACRIIHDENYPETQAKMIEMIYNEADSRGIDLDYSRESIKDLVSTIYKFKP